MHPLCIFSVVALVLSSVYACEEICKSGTISKIMDKYTTDVLEPYFLRKEKELQVSHSLDPLRIAIKLDCPGVLIANVFGHFRGKCQRNGVTPEGCPNPDCPSRCGTPGSMVHFYSTLRRLAFESFFDVIKNHTDTASPTYRQIQARVEQGRESRKRETPMRFQPRPDANHDVSLPILYMRQPFEIQPDVDRALNSKRERHSTHVAVSLGRIPSELETICGRLSKESETDLKHCSWRTEMTKFILQYP
ncbi:hypothetical protein L218DRAFT_280554 [Marasmius fiardii PR-910]|nr:hypothetical protein L218DRAFT_280554 [Marasmius fiardii PR-910]